jgi:GT2 family glycosyltransferase
MPDIGSLLVLSNPNPVVRMSNMAAVDLSIIIVNWNTRQLLGQCLSSLFQSSDGMLLEVIVVDNNSKDDSVEYVTRYFPEVQIIQNNHNRGFAAASNQGLARAKGRNILFLNSDTIVHEGALKMMAELLDDTPEAGLCSCRLLNENGSIQANVYHFPSFRAMLQRYTALKYLGLFKSARAFYKMRDFSYDKIASVDFVMGAALMVKRKVLEHIGNIDENLYFYFEDTDLCYRIKQAGFKIYFTPNAQITHLGRASSSLLGSHKTHAMFFKSLLYYFRKHKGKGKTFLFSCVFKPGVCLYMLCEVIFGSCSALVFWCLRRSSVKIHRRLERARECFLFLTKYGVRFLLY